MLVTPVINMSGNCEEAIHYYEEVFSTKADFILHYSDAKPEDWKNPLTDEQKTYVYHAEMKIGNQRFMFSDIIDFEICHGNSLFIVGTFDTKEGLYCKKVCARIGEENREKSSHFTPENGRF